MKYIILVCSIFSLLLAFDQVEVKDNSPFWYVYLDFQKDWTFIGTGINTFLLECELQGIQEQISGPLFQIFFDEEKPLWGVGYPLKEKISVKPPLLLSEYNYNKVAVKLYSGEYHGLAMVYHKINLYAEEKGMEPAGPMIAFFPQNMGQITGTNYQVAVMLPVVEQARSTIIINKIYNFVLSMASFLYLLFAVFLFLHKRGKRLSNIIFSIFLFANAMNLINWLAYNFRYFLYDSFPHIFEIGSSFVFLTAPLLFLYTQSQVYVDFSLKKIYLLHCIPFILDLLHKSYRFHFLSASLKRNLFISRSIYTDFENILRSAALDLQNIIYLSAALFLLYKYRRQIKMLYSAVEKINLSWLQTVLYGYLLIYLIGMIKHKIFILSGIYVDILGLMLIFGFLIFAAVIIFKGLQQPEIFSGIEQNNHKRKYERSKLADEDKERYLNKLLTYMETQKPYLNSMISLKDLADQVAISPYYLSQIINECLNQNFFDFINGYRIKECKKLFMDADQNDKSILEIIYSAGFNSKSVFNPAFRKFTGMTPSQFRKQVNTIVQSQE
jgi:AraC-like DNA-binding protein/effector-binding domain-containing protein